MTRDPARAAPLRPFALGLLVVYSLALFLSALPAEARPGFLDRPSAIAESVLRLFAVRGGIAVFEPPRERVVKVLRNDCIYVRGLDAAGRSHWLQPTDGRCTLTGLRLSIPDVEWMLRSLLTGGEGFHAVATQEAVVGDFFCHAPPWRELGLREIELLWVQPRFDIDTGEERTEPVFAFRWRCEPPGVMSEANPPSEAAVRAFLGAGS